MEIDKEVLSDIIFLEKNLSEWINNLDSNKFTKFEQGKEYSFEELLILNHTWKLEYEIFKVNMILDRMLEWYSKDTVMYQSSESNEQSFVRKAVLGNISINYVYELISDTQEDIVIEEFTVNYKSRLGNICVVRPIDNDVTFIPGKWIDELKEYAVLMIKEKENLSSKNNLFISPYTSIFLDKENNDVDNFFEEYKKNLHNDLLMNLYI